MKHREYVSGLRKVNDFDMRGAYTFIAALTGEVREWHYVLDLGCGSLAAGKLLIPWLQHGHYFGIDPNKWLIDDGLRYEVSDSRGAQFAYNDDFRCDQWDTRFDYIIATSVVSHTGCDLFQKCIAGVKRGLKPNGRFLFTYCEMDKRHSQALDGWIYPNTVPYPREQVAGFLAEAGFEMYLLPTTPMFNQQWAMGVQR